MVALKIREIKDWAKWARWAKIFKITQPDNQLCLPTCFLVFASLNQNIYSFLHLSVLKSEKNEQAKWAKWARILKNNLTDEQLCSLICCLIFACLNIYQYICSFIAFEIRKKSELSELKCSKSPLHMSSYAHKHVFLYLPAQLNLDTLLYWSYIKS